MRRKRRTHSPEFKAKVALGACQGELTMAELVKKYDVHANQVTDWKRQLRNRKSMLNYGKELKKLPKGSSALFICVFAFLSGCATNAVESSIPRLSDYELCGDFQRYGMINVHQGLRKEEIEKRGLDCSDSQFASAEADSLRRYEQQKQRRSAATQSGESQVAGAILEGFKNAAEIANRNHQETYFRSDRASGLENLKGLEGWSVVHVGKVTGFIDGKDFSKAESFSFEGCSIGRVLVVDLTKRVVCRGYKYHYAYHPKITVLTKSSSEFKALVDGQIFDVAR